MKKTIFLVFGFASLIFLLISCRVSYYDWMHESCNWICDNPKTIIYRYPIQTFNEKGDKIKSIDGYIELDGTTYEVNVSAHNTLKYGYLYFNDETQEGLSQKNIIFRAKVSVEGDLMYWCIYESYN